MADRLFALDRQTLAMLRQARVAGALRLALAAVRESRGNVEALARLGVASGLERRLVALEQAGMVAAEGVKAEGDGDGAISSAPTAAAPAWSDLHPARQSRSR